MPWGSREGWVRVPGQPWGILDEALALRASLSLASHGKQRCLPDGGMAPGTPRVSGWDFWTGAVGLRRSIKSTD